MTENPSVTPSSPELPDTQRWQPKFNKAESLQNAFKVRCHGAERLMLMRTELERVGNIHNFDSGAGLEDIVREEFRRICPKRYSIYAGTINDRKGNTAGDADLLIFNDFWFPIIKTGATPESRKVHFPIEGVYGVVEVKQTLDYKTLDEAMEKLVTCHRLHRPQTFANRLVENRDRDACFHGLTNPLYSAILATRLGEGTELQDVVNRFYDINKTLSRLEVVRSLCVLGHGTVTWAFTNDNGERSVAMFMREDLFHDIYPVFWEVPQVSSALYPLMVDLLLHLYHSVLGAEDIAAAYGMEGEIPQVPATSEIMLAPDQEWVDRLDLEYDENGNRAVRQTGNLPPLSELHFRHRSELRQQSRPT